MTILRLLNWQGIAGIAASLALLGLLVAQHIDASHWQTESGRFQALYNGEQLALAQTEANYRAAADQAQADDKANAERVATQQSAINQESSNDYEKRLADARAAAERLRQQLAASAAYPGGGSAAAMPGLSAAPGRPAQAAREDGLSDSLTATEQAIQLDELIKWVRRQAAVNPNGGPGEQAAVDPDGVANEAQTATPDPGSGPAPR